MRLWDSFLRWFSRTDFWLWFSRDIVAHYTFRHWGYPTYPCEHLFRVCKAIQASEAEEPGVYAFVETDGQSLAAKLIRAVTGGFWTHAGWILPRTYDPETITVAHMKAKGMLVGHVLSVMKECDHFAVVKFTTPKLSSVKAAIERAVANREKFTYDFQQEIGNSKSSLYCSEFVLVMMLGLVPGVGPRHFWGRLVFDPDDVVKSGSVIYSSHDGI